MKSNSIIRTAMVLFLAMFTTTVWADVNFGNVFEKEETEVVTYTKGQQATIILPVTPDAGKGKYYRLDRVEDYQIIFEEEPHPQARVPYIIIPNEDFSIDMSTLNLTGFRRDSTNIEGVFFIGTYVKDVIGYKDSYYYYTIDATSDCRNDMNRYNVYVGALRAFIQVRIWNNGEKMPIVIHDAGSEPIIINGTYPTFIDEGNEWHYANICEMVDTSIVVEENFAKYYFKGDTIINQKKYKQLWGDFIYRNTESHPKKKPGTSYGSGYVMGVREEEGKVFVNVEEYDKQLMMFSYEEQKWNLTKEDDEYVLYDFNSPSNYVIPEVGSKLDLIFPYPLQRMDYWDGIIRTWNLNLFYCDGQLIYKSQNYYPDLFFLIDGIAINETNFPDINFRNWLLSQEYGKDGILTDEEISDITEINVEKKDIANLQGIEKFTSLTSLYCSINELTTLDLSGCPQLNALDCSFNKQLASINLSGCKALQHLYCHGCKLTAIDLTDCTELIYLDCGTNLLTTIDPSPCKKVMSFVCSGNQLTTIDISACKALRSFDCQENQLTTLDCSNLTELQAILCAMNALTSINISGCSKLIHLLCEFNNLGLDAFQHIMTNIPERDESDGAFMFVYSESTIEGSYDHTPDHNICSKEQVAIAKAKGWVVYYENNTGDSLPYEGVEVTPEIAYRPFIEDGKVWKVGVWPGKLVKIVDYLYFDGDTIVNGQTAKRMLRDRVTAKEWESQNIEREYVGALYEKDKKVYCMNVYDNDFELLYDFSLNVGDTINLYDFIVYGDDGIRGVVTKRATGGLNGFKGNYLDIQATWEDKYWSEEDMMEIPVVYNQINHWLEGVGSYYPPLDPRFISFRSPFMTGGWFVLMSCSIGDEVIYFDDQYEDGTTTQGEAKKRRFDFTHTVKIQPKTPSRREEEAALYGEYTDRLLDIDLNPLVEAYSVCITNQKTGETLYEKNINAGSIVALNIDISKYPEGQYKISIDNSNETFNGVFDTSTTGINEIMHNSQFIMHNDAIFNLQGQRIKTLQKGLNIVNGKKVLVK